MSRQNQNQLHQQGAEDGAPADFSSVPEFADYGKVLKSNRPVQVTESETEYVVTAISHIFESHIVLQFLIRNTLPDTLLESVSVLADPEAEDELTEDFIIPIQQLAGSSEASVYVSYQRVDPSAYTVTSCSNKLKFASREIDPSTGEPDENAYEDEYELEELQISAGSYLKPTYIADYAKAWTELTCVSSETFVLGITSSLKGKRLAHISCL